LNLAVSTSFFSASPICSSVISTDLPASLHCYRKAIAGRQALMRSFCRRERRNLLTLGGSLRPLHGVEMTKVGHQVETTREKYSVE
ncbi:MAG: hypothetical protein WCG48_03480, partial [Candidatus Berkelbacteria bacterium]